MKRTFLLIAATAVLAGCGDGGALNTILSTSTPTPVPTPVPRATPPPTPKPGSWMWQNKGPLDAPKKGGAQDQKKGGTALDYPAQKQQNGR